MNPADPKSSADNPKIPLRLTAEGLGTLVTILAGVTDPIGNILDNLPIDLGSTHYPTIAGRPLNLRATIEDYDLLLAPEVVISYLGILPGGMNLRPRTNTPYREPSTLPPPPKRRKRSSPRYRILIPNGTGQRGYTWPGLTAGPSPNIPGQLGLLVDAPGRSLPAGSYIPILGRQETKWDFPPPNDRTHLWKYTDSLKHLGWVDGDPTRDPRPFNQIACRGLGIAMMANEPPIGSPNCIFKQNCLVTTVDVPHGVELTVFYGGPSHYTRNYPVDEEAIQVPQGRVDLVPSPPACTLNPKIMAFRKACQLLYNPPGLPPNPPHP